RACDLELVEPHSNAFAADYFTTGAIAGTAGRHPTAGRSFSPCCGVERERVQGAWRMRSRRSSARRRRGAWDPVLFAWKKVVSLRLRYLDRMVLGTPYPDVVERAVQVTQWRELVGRCRLAVD